MLSLSLTDKILCIVGSLIAIAYLGITVGLWLGQSRLIFVPSRKLESTPDAMGLVYEAVWIPVLEYRWQGRTTIGMVVAQYE